MIYIKGLIVKIKDTDKLVLTKQPLTLVEANILKDKYQAQGHTVYLGTEIKVFRVKKISNNNLITALII